MPQFHYIVLFTQYCCCAVYFCYAVLLFVLQIRMNTRKLRSNMLTRLRQALTSSDDVRMERVFLANLPTEDQHSQHYVGPVSAFSTTNN